MTHLSDRIRLSKILSSYGLVAMEDEFLRVYDIYLDCGRFYFRRNFLYRLTGEKLATMSDQEIEDIAIECAIESMAL